MLPLNISPKADRLLACSVPANFHYVTAPPPKKGREMEEFYAVVIFH